LSSTRSAIGSRFRRRGRQRGRPPYWEIPCRSRRLLSSQADVFSHKSDRDRAKLSESLGDEREQKPRKDYGYDNDLHWGPRRLLNMLLIKNVAAEMKLDQREEPPSQTDHGAAFVVEMNDGHRWQVIAAISGIGNSFTVIGVNMIGQAPVELSDLLDHLTRNHNRGTGHITGDK